MPNKQYIPHGRLTVKVEDNILFVEGTGPWNLESVNQSDEDAVGAKEQLYGQPWGCIVTLFGDPLHVPEAAKALSSAIKEDVANGRNGTAIILSHCDSPQMAKRHISDIYQQTGETLEFFNDFDEGMTWLKAKLK